MDIISLLLFVLVIVKTAGMVNHIRWIKKKGSNYLKEIEIKNPKNQADYFKILKELEANFFPFGFKDYKLRLKSANNILFKIFLDYFYRFQRLIITLTIYIVFILYYFDFTIIISPDYHKELIVLTYLIVLFMNVLLSIETLYSYFILGNYANYFHMLQPISNDGTSSFELLELKVLTTRLASSIISGTNSIYLTLFFFDSIKGNISCFNIHNAINYFKIYLQSLYFTVTTILTVGFGDIVPNNFLGQFNTLLIELLSFSILGILFTSFFSIIKK